MELRAVAVVCGGSFAVKPLHATVHSAGVAAPTRGLLCKMCFTDYTLYTPCHSHLPLPQSRLRALLRRISPGSQAGRQVRLPERRGASGCSTSPRLARSWPDSVGRAPLAGGGGGGGWPNRSIPFGLGSRAYDLRDERGSGGMEEVAVAAAAAGMERAAACNKRPRGALDGGGSGSSAAAPPWRACRVARAAAGGKDRHSKVVTARGLRDRRVRLSVPTAIQFYDIQDRLGVDQPSKAIEWLIRAAANAIDGLPELDCSFALPAAAGDASPPGAAAGDDAEVSTSDTSKSSVLSLANNAPADNAAAQQVSHAYNGNAGAFAHFLHCSANDSKPVQQQQPTLAYYAAPALSFEAMPPHLSFLQEQPQPTVAFDRGTLQSNAAAAAPLWPMSQQACLLQRFAASPADATGLPFFLGGGAAAPPVVPDNSEPRLQLWDFKQERKT